MVKNEKITYSLTKTETTIHMKPSPVTNTARGCVFMGEQTKYRLRCALVPKLK